ncbi:MAG: hypothetical protein PHY92_11075 [Alphaproteobacteria bacterium]|nr:hypothetical protein [Alphaproteobacteria bacterium]
MTYKPNGLCPASTGLWMAMLLTAALLTACASSHGKGSNARHTGSVRIVYSPNGEPLSGGLLGYPACKDAMPQWFARVDMDNDGNISREEFLADARTQFGRMDIDKNGYLLSEELERFRKPYREYVTETSGNQQNSKTESREKPPRRRLEKPEDSNNSSNHRAESRSPRIQADPVMTADINNDFKVTFTEYLAQAQKTFNETDADHNDLLSGDEIQTFCEQGR